MTKRRRNRVTPYGELIAVPERGMFWGNRGVLVDDHGQLARYSRGRAWMICVLEYKGIRRQQWTPRRLTELYFLDEATDRRLHADRLLAPSVRRTYRAGAQEPAGEVDVITPLATVATLAAGYRPVPHPICATTQP